MAEKETDEKEPVNELRNVKKEEKEKPEKNAPKKKSSPPREKKEKVSFSQKVKSSFAFLKNEKLHKVTGVFLLFMVTPYLLIAFTSFLFSWQADFDKVSGSWRDLFFTDVKVQNWLGKFGAVISYLFIHRGFGIASFAFPFLSFLIGARILFKKAPLPVRRSIAFSSFALVFVSVSLGYIFTDRLFYLGGTVGFQTATWLNLSLGTAGTGFLLAFSMLTFLILAFNLSFDWFSKKQEELPLEATGEVVPVVTNEIKSEAFDLGLKKEEEKAPLNEIVLPIEKPAEKEEPKRKEPEILIGTGDEIMLEVNEVVKEEEVTDEDKLDPVEQFGEYDPTLDLSSYEPPSIELLHEHGTNEITVNKEELNANSAKIIETLRNYDIEIASIKATIGPTVTLYEIVPAPGVKISKIKNLEDDIALSLAALGIRIIAPMPGKGTIGIEVPNQHPETVSMRSLIASEKFQNVNMELPIAFGKTISNETLIADLTKMPHLLMAGATGQGKSVGLNAILVSLLYKKHPSQLKFILVDPKKVELTLFNKIERHFLAKLPDAEEAIITDTKQVTKTLNSLCTEMDTRYNLLKDAQVRNIKEYNAKFIARKLNPNNGHRYLPYLVLVVDEFADLMATAGKEVEAPIARLAQLARAIGIHLIIATQRPSVNVITGLIKANFPTRIAFRVTAKVDSRTILDASGADQLVGRGDMLLSNGSDVIRLQCAFVDTPEVEKITEFIGSQRAYPEAYRLPEVIDENEGGLDGIDPSERDKFFDDAARIVVTHQQGSASLLQRKLKLGYNRAGRIIDQLEAAGIIGPFEGSKAREVLIKDMLTLEQFLNKAKEEKEKAA